MIRVLILLLIPQIAFGAWSFVGVGTEQAATSSNVLTLAESTDWPTYSEGDLLVLAAAMSADADTEELVVSAGWTELVTDARCAPSTNSIDIVIYGRIATASESDVTVTCPNCAGGDVKIAQIASFSGAPASITGIVHASGTAVCSGNAGSGPYDIDTPALTISEDNTLVIAYGGVREAWDAGTETITYQSGFTGLDFSGTGAADDVALGWSYQIQTTASNVSADDFSVSGPSSFWDVAAGQIVSLSAPASSAAVTQARRRMQ